MDDFLKLLDETIEECRREIKRRTMGIAGEATLQQLKEVVMPELLTLRKVSQEDLPTKEKRWLNSFALAFKLWGWDMHNPTRLYLLLLKLDKAYKQL